MDKIEKAAEKYADNNSRRWHEDGDIYYDHNKIMDAFKAGAEWQKEQDEKEQADLFTIVALDAAQRAKEQMLKDAFVESLIIEDGRIELEGDQLPCLNPIILLPYPQFKPGDKVKIIVLKAEEE